MPTVDVGVTDRMSKSPWSLVRQTMGDRRARWQKVAQLVRVLQSYGDTAKVEARLERLRRLGYIDEVPNRTQRIVGALDMMRFFIVPCAADYYAAKGLDFRFHTLLRFLDDPASLIDPTGFNSTPDAIIGHVMQVVHANPQYDFQLLESFEDGLEQMERQVVDLLAGVHPRSRSILSIVEDPSYHARLLEHIRAFRRDPNVAPLLRDNVVATPEFAAVERTFGTVAGAMRYFAKMPRTTVGAVRHLLRVRTFPSEFASA